MKWKSLSLQTRLYFIGAIILLVGLGGAVVIYLTAENPADSALIHDFENSKRYIHDLELYGGKMNVLADEFRRWFDGLWRGKTLAFTVGAIASFISLGCFFVAYHMTSTSESAAQDENQRGATKRQA